MSNIDSILARSNELLARVRRQIDESPSYLSELIHPPSRPVAVPFAPTSISLDDTAHSIQTAGDQPPEADETSRPSANDEEAQRRLREYFAQKLSALNMRPSASHSLTAEEMPHASNTDENQQQQQSEDESHEEEEEFDVYRDRKRILDEPFVFVSKQTTLLQPETPILSTSDILHPIQYDEDVDNVNFIEQDIAADGLWVPDLPLCKPENVRRMEYRLIWDDPGRQKYFGADLTLKIDTPPISQIPPPFPIEPLDHYGRGIITFQPASVWGLEDIDIKREFKIEVEDVQFLIHPLSCKEDIITKKIVQLYNAYEKDQGSSRVSYYKQKIEALREAWRKAFNDEKVDEEKKCLVDLHDCRELQEMEENNSRMIREHLQESYRELREIRSNSITVSPLILRWKRRNFNEDEKAEEQKIYDKELRHRIQEEKRLLELNNIEPNEADIRREIKQRADTLGLRKPGEALWKPVLEYNFPTTPIDECPPQEKERRDQISHAQIFLKYFVNKQETHKSNFSQLNENFVAAFTDSKKWVSNIIPHTIKVEIWETGYFKGSRFIASVFLPITVGTLPEFKSYEFTSDLTNSEGQLVVGTLSARCYITPESKGEIFISCPDGQDQKMKKRLAQDPSKFISLPNLAQSTEKYDPNDPYMASILSQTIAQRTSELSADDRKIKIDTMLENSLFSSLVPTSIGMQLQQHMERLRFQDEEERKKSKKKEEGPKNDYLSQVKNRKEVQEAKISGVQKLTEIVNEAPMPPIPKITDIFKILSIMYRPLKPIRKLPTSSSYTQPYMEAVIRITQGFNIPQRTVTGTGPGTSSSLIYSSAQNESANVYCRITLNGKEKCTRKVNGSDSNWNQDFKFPLSENADTRPQKSELAKLTFRIDIFDEVVYKVINDDREHQTNHENIEHRILGYVLISLQSLWVKDYIQGVFPVITPPFQLAYTKPDKPIGLSIFGAINPVFRDEEAISEVESSESEEVILRAQAWLKKINDTIKGFKDKRRIVLMAAPTSGKPIIACRMVKKQAPPDIFSTKEQLVRFVSMIPNYSDAEVFDTADSMWCTSQEFLNINAGDDEEHALLLCNYFKYIGLEAYVVLGFDYVNGKTTFVVTKESNKVTIYDPMTGNSWSSKNRDCILYSVGMIFNDENVWANIQKDASPHSIKWNIHNTKEWYPFFSLEFPMKQFDSPQNDILIYKPTDEIKARQIERDLTNRIQVAVETWRKHKRTSWNPEFSARIHYALERCEAAAMMDPSSVNLQSITDEFKANFPHYRMNGGPFCLPYTTYDDIIEEVQRREAWETESRFIEFAIGVFVVPYPNSLFAVWVMLATLEMVTTSGELPL